jgi:Putative peptidoglycan binding domain
MLTDFYTAFSAACFSLLGLWLVIITINAGAWLKTRQSRAYAVALYFAAPGTMSLLALINPLSPTLWRVFFIIVSVLGGAGLLLFGPLAHRRHHDALDVSDHVVHWIAIVLYLVIAVLAFSPLHTLRIEGVLLTVLVLLGVHFALRLMFAIGTPANSAAICQGATGPTVRWAQYLLARRTLSSNQIDGIFGPVTKTAVEQFQRDSRLTIDGIVGAATWAALGGDGPQPPTLAEGSGGSVAGRLQTALNAGRGYFAPGSAPVLAVDGIYGPKTATAVRAAQQLGGIAADGVVGLQTWALPVYASGHVLANLCDVPGPGGG